MVRRAVVGLLMLATLLVYAAPGYAGLLPPPPPQAPHGQVLAGTQDGAVACHEGPCGDLGLTDDVACCSVAPCAAMHGGILAGTVMTFAPVLDRTNHLPALAMPDGIGSVPALRPPCPII